MANAETKKSKKTYGKKNGRTSYRKDMKENDVKSNGGDKLSSLNDLSWYNRFPELLEAAGRIPFAKVPGMPVMGNVDLVSNSDGTDNTVIGYATTTIPGFFAIDWVPSVGYSDDNVSPISIVAREMYAKVRSKFSGTLDENGPDIVMYLMGLDSIFSMLGYMKRIYRALNTVSPFNKDLPYGVLAAMGFTASEVDNMLKNKTAIWGQINDLINKSAKFTCPDVMDVFKRHYWMSSNIYGDDNSPKAQFYLFNQVRWFTYDETGSTGGSLKCGEPAHKTWDGFYDYTVAMIKAMSSSDDVYTINGHLMRTFEGVPSFKVDLLQPDEVLDTVYVPEVLSQIHNARCAADAMQDASFDITQDPATNSVIHKPAVYLGRATANRKFIFAPKQNLLLDLRSDVPSVADITIASRLAYVIYEASTDPHVYYVRGGTEIPIGFRIIADNGQKSINVPHIINMDNNNPTSLSELLSYLNFFDWSPIVYLSGTYSGGSAGSPTRIYPMSELHNTTPVQCDALVDLHRVCVLSEFNAYGV